MQLSTGTLFWTRSLAVNTCWTNSHFDNNYNYEVAIALAENHVFLVTSLEVFSYLGSCDWHMTASLNHYTAGPIGTSL